MAKYDDASWHYGGDYPKDLPNESAATHIGMFLQWLIENDLISAEFKEIANDEIRQVKEREISGAELLINVCDEALIDDDLNELGANFAIDYYNNETEFSKQYASFTDDYAKVFDDKAERNGFEYKSIYHVENTFENYDLLKPIIDKRFEQWKKYKDEGR
jgi:hypothetical protein